ncbi:MAG: prolipoprotein diacylglyceryl transferase, partial [Mycobacterium sp.]|nr:prolipoprotein diacylglyceryl transferase [Mycobacterium sp.]
SDDPLGAFRIREGGLGIWGGVAGGAGVGLWVAHRRHLNLAVLLDVVAPAIPLAQSIGRWGNWFNQELYGRPTTLPWAVRIDPAHRVAGYEQYATFQPTFLYESIWCLGVAALCIWADKRFRMGGGRVFALYVASYTAGRGWIESLRIDTAERFFGLRLNDYVSIVVFLLAVTYLIVRRGARDVPIPSDALGGDATKAESIRVDLVKPGHDAATDDAKSAEPAPEPDVAEPPPKAPDEAEPPAKAPPPR